MFSRRQDYHLDIEQGIVPIHMDDDTSSLSAILLNDDFYNFMMNVELEGLVKEKVSEFLDTIKNEKIELQKLGVEGKSMDQILATYRKIYNLEE